MRLSNLAAFLGYVHNEIFSLLALDFQVVWIFTLVVFLDLVLGLIFAHWAQEEHAVLILLDQLRIKTDTLRMVPLALVLAFDVLLVVILSRAQAVDFRLVSWRVDHQGISSIVRSCINNSRGMWLSLTLMCFFTVCIERQMIVPWSSHFMFVGSLLSWMDIVRMTSLRDECSISHMLLMLLLRKYHI